MSLFDEQMEQLLYEAFFTEERTQAELRLSQQEAGWLRTWAHARCTPLDEARPAGEKAWYSVQIGQN